MAHAYIIPDETAKKLAYGNLLDVFSNRDVQSRLVAVKETYHAEVTFYGPDAIHTGHDAVNAEAQKLLDDRPGWAFVPQGIVTKNHDMLYLAWGFGPVGDDGLVDVRTRGADVLIVEQGKVKKFWVIIEGITDVKG
ncbi:hypothetical protein G647_00043 [Cladophialophora carrionii CBS 160.54]|uniref:Uncharacterized protein n=1 Tax=Cladophialophora carrionii CBS 160.54 TaxID=1279043 RepID=V9DL00_9EURO|nr:uncharacterized protein G647_00043 [Cladophialophora carrionii CBS 160.54]ETI27594.1 hypothetical protein G647_00043 [Cladophialophora carrionii CBS 160.54]